MGRNFGVHKMIIVYENNCQVQSDIFLVREESKIIDKQGWKFDINSGAREPDLFCKTRGMTGWITGEICSATGSGL
jgi:hypothetical protein